MAFYPGIIYRILLLCCFWLLCRTIGAAAIREASSPAAVMKNRPVNVAITEASPPAAVVKHSPVNVAATETLLPVTEPSTPVVLTKHKPMQTAKMTHQRQEACHKSGTQKAKGQGENTNSVTGKICSILCCIKSYKNVWHMLQSLPIHRQARALAILCVLCIILYNTVKTNLLCTVLCILNHIQFSLQHLSSSIDAILSEFSHNVVSTQHIQMVILCKQQQNN